MSDREKRHEAVFHQTVKGQRHLVQEFASGVACLLFLDLLAAG